jgi:hypothetical protein
MSTRQVIRGNESIKKNTEDIGGMTLDKTALKTALKTGQRTTEGRQVTRAYRGPRSKDGIIENML